MGRIVAWFGGLSTAKKAIAISCALLLFVLFSPLIVPIAVLVLLVSLATTSYRMLRRRPFKRPAIFLISSLVAVVLASGVSNALYGTAAEQTSTKKPEQTQSAPEPTTKKTEAKTEKTERAETTNAEPVKAEKPDQAAPKTNPAPKPKPAPAAKKEDSLDERGTVVTVSRVVDGDTIETSPAVEGIEDVRLIGMDTPEIYGGIEPYGREASAYTKEKLSVGQRVALELDAEHVDPYDRLLAYVWMPDGSMFNETIVKDGYAQVATFPPNVKYEDRFLSAQKQARAEGAGLWGLSDSEQCELADRGNGIGDCAAPEPAPEPTSEPTPTPEPQPEPEPTSEPAPSAPQSGLPPYPGGPDSPSTCEEVGGGPYAVPPGSTHDADGDGQACE